VTVDRPAVPPRASLSHRGILFTDLDGTLLDFDSYRPSQTAQNLVDGMAQDGILTVPVTSKTAAEVVEITGSTRLAPIAVVEGGAVLLLEDGSTTIIGSRREALIDVLRALRDDGWDVRGFSDMTTGELADLTGLDHAAARRAMERSASEPFLIAPPVPPDVDKLHRRASELGAGITRGGRFWHLIGHGIDKGSGVRIALETIGRDRPTTTGAVGDAWNDVPMLECVDYPYFLGTRVPPAQLPPGVHRISEEGPGGFVIAARAFRTVCMMGIAGGASDRAGEAESRE
jgi:mannosyl-3-phosphoglycerate phosphatase